ncbi:ATP-binding protein [Mesorhizobium sp.]|uniref:sensor histidine kinase n=1 Tax=Mesorhizobium sp. TaxID=1871066 RepID=UPI00257C5D2E|nr:ATP-binding protein [Mesorhizobium sp.]
MRGLTRWLPRRSAFTLDGISPIHLSFTQEEDEIEYRAVIFRSSIIHIRLAFGLATFIAIFYAFFDHLLYENDTELLEWAYAIRFGLLVPAAIILVILTLSNSYQKYSQIAGLFIVIIFGAGWFLLAFRTTPAAVIDNYSSILMTLIYGFFFTGLFFKYSFPAGLCISVLYFLAIVSVNLDSTVETSLITSLSVIFFLLSFAAYQKEFVSRRLFVTETREREARARQAQHDSRYLEWLRSLAKFLRHEVRQPVAQVNSGIELIKVLGKHDAKLSSLLDSAALSTQHIWNLIERASMATDAEAYVRQGASQMVDLRPIIHELVSSYQRTSADLHFSFVCDTSAWVLADPTLVEEAMRNLLNNAVSYAIEQTTIEVTLAVMDRQVVMTVYNRGPLAPADTETLFGLFSSTRAGPVSEHQGLGLYLVRLIAERHGGRAELTNVQDGSGVRASISLPIAATSSTLQPTGIHGRVRT